MSIKIMSQIWEKSSAKGSRLLLLIAMADWANDEGICWPSIPSMARKCRLSDRYVQTILEKFKRDGLIIPFGQSEFGTTRYKLTIGGGEAGLTGGGEAGLTVGGEAGLTGGVRRASPKPPLNRHLNPPADSVKKPKQVKDDSINHHHQPTGQVGGGGDNESISKFGLAGMLIKAGCPKNKAHACIAKAIKAQHTNAEIKQRIEAALEYAGKQRAIRMPGFWVASAVADWREFSSNGHRSETDLSGYEGYSEFAEGSDDGRTL